MQAWHCDQPAHPQWHTASDRLIGMMPETVLYTWTISGAGGGGAGQGTAVHLGFPALRTRPRTARSARGRDSVCAWCGAAVTVRGAGRGRPSVTNQSDKAGQVFLQLLPGHGSSHMPTRYFGRQRKKEKYCSWFQTTILGEGYFQCVGSHSHPQLAQELELEQELEIWSVTAVHG